MAWTWYRDGSPVTQQDLGELQTAESTTWVVELWWHRDNPRAEPAEDVMLQASTEDPALASALGERPSPSLIAVPIT